MGGPSHLYTILLFLLRPSTRVAMYPFNNKRAASVCEQPRRCRMRFAIIFFPLAKPFGTGIANPCSQIACGQKRRVGEFFPRNGGVRTMTEYFFKNRQHVCCNARLLFLPLKSRFLDTYLNMCPLVSFISDAVCIVIFCFAECVGNYIENEENKKGEGIETR